MLLAEAAVRIGVDDSQARSRTKGFLGFLKGTMGGAGAVAGGLMIDRLAGAIVRAGPAMISAASDAAESRSKFETVFGDLTDEADAWATKLADRVQRASSEMVKMGAELQDTFKPFGFANDQAFALTQTVQELAIDLGSFNNMSDDDAMARLQSGLVGSHDALRKFGVIVNQTTLDQELLNMGIEGGSKAASEQQKMLARLNIILASTKDAQGDATRTAGGFANQLKGFNAQLLASSQDIGSLFLAPLVSGMKFLRPIISDLTGMITGFVESAKQSAANFSESFNIGAKFSGLMAEIGPPLQAAGGMIQEFYLNVFHTFMDMGSFIGKIGSAVGLGEVATLIGTNVPKVIGLLDDLYYGFNNIFSDIRDIVFEAIEVVVSSLQSLEIGAYFDTQFGEAQSSIDEFFDGFSFALRNMKEVGLLAISNLVIGALEMFPMMQEPLDELVAFFSGMWAGASAGMDAFVGNVLAGFEEIKNVFSAVMSAIGASIDSIMSGDLASAPAAFTSTFIETLASQKDAEGGADPIEEFQKAFKKGRDEAESQLKTDGGVAGQLKKYGESLQRDIEKNEAEFKERKEKRLAALNDAGKDEVKPASEEEKEKTSLDPSLFDEDKGGKKKSTASFVGLQELQKQVQIGAFGKDPAEKTAKNTEDMVKQGEKSVKLLTDMVDKDELAHVLD